MRKAVRMICLTSVLTVAMLLLWGPSCEAAPTYMKVKIVLDLNGPAPEIYVDTPGNRFAGLCRNWSAATKKQCRGNQFEWQLVVQGGQLNTGDEVRIWNAPDHPVCFGPDPVHVFNDANASTHHESGPPAIACAEDKYGTYWPYVIEYWKGGILEASTDPGGIIFP